MRITYLLLSSTFGMHQYTADLANRRVDCGDEVTLVTTSRYVADRYNPRVQVEAVIDSTSTGLSLASLKLGDLVRVMAAVRRSRPDLVHVTGPHIWNAPIMRRLRRWGIPTVQTIHDVEPHADGAYGWMVRRWNRAVVRQASLVLVHARGYEQHVVALGATQSRITVSPLLHQFTSYEAQTQQRPLTADSSKNTVLFFGRIEAYKGVAQLLSAWQRLEENGAIGGFRLVLAGRGDLASIWPGPLPPRVELRNRHIPDDEAEMLLSQAALLVLPYTRATQSALIAASYSLGTPVLVTDSGALSEYVVPDETGWVVPSNDVVALADGLQVALADRARLCAMGEAGRTWYKKERQRENAILNAMYKRVADKSGAHLNERKAS